MAASLTMTGGRISGFRTGANQTFTITANAFSLGSTPFVFSAGRFVIGDVLPPAKLDTATIARLLGEGGER